MDEARAVLARLDRIEALERQRAPAGVLLDEVRALLAEAEAWVRAEPAGTERAVDALERCRKAAQNAQRTLVA
jgi:predicted metal-dependent hydrolase